MLVICGIHCAHNHRGVSTPKHQQQDGVHPWGWCFRLPVYDPNTVLTLALFAGTLQRKQRKQAAQSMVLVGKLRVRLSTLTVGGMWWRCYLGKTLFVGCVFRVFLLRCGCGVSCHCCFHWVLPLGTTLCAVSCWLITYNTIYNTIDNTIYNTTQPFIHRMVCCSSVVWGYWGIDWPKMNVYRK